MTHSWLARGRTAWGEVYDLPAMVEEFADALRAELDYRREGSDAERIRRNFAGEPSLHVPSIYWQPPTPITRRSAG